MKYDRIARWRFGVLALGIAALAACGPSEEVQRQLAELQTVSAEKDSLLAQVSDNARIMSDIGAELAKASSPANVAGTQEGGKPDPAAIMEQIQGLTTRLNESEARLIESQKRVQSLTRTTKNQETRLAEFDQTISNLHTTIENQKQTILSLTEQVTNLQEENVTLVARNTALEETVTDLATKGNTVYYVVGTKDELLQKGIVTEEGGSRVLFVFGKRGKTLVPGRDIDLSQLTAVDQRELTTITLPEPDKDYRIVSTQDATALATPPNEDGKIRGELQITDPDRFWAQSKVLIVVRT